MFLLHNGKVQMEWFPREASTVINNGDALKWDGSGDLVPAAADDTVPIAVVSLKKVATTDADYATDGVQIPGYMLMPDSVFVGDVGAGTATAANIGIAYDLFDAGSVDLTATDHKVVTVVGIIDASHVLVKFSSAYEFVNVS